MRTDISNHKVQWEIEEQKNIVVAVENIEFVHARGVEEPKISIGQGRRTTWPILRK